MFHLPATVWRMLSNQSGESLCEHCVRDMPISLFIIPVYFSVPTNILGLNVGLILHTACNELNIDPVVRERTVDILARHVEDALRYQREFGNRQKSVFLFALINVGKLYGAYVTIVYTFVKCIHLMNVAFQFYLINTFLETADYPLFGGHVIYDLLRVSTGIKSIQHRMLQRDCSSISSG